MALSIEATTHLHLDPVDSDPRETIDLKQHDRASTYALLAALLRSAPVQAQLDYLGGLVTHHSTEDTLAQTLSALSLSAQKHTLGTVNQEFHDLFIGLGRGEVVPYGSWYLTGFLMEKPLSDLRDDLLKLGFERNPDTVEPEDHVAALFEVLSIMIHDLTAHSIQNDFFDTHIASWVGQFFKDLSTAHAAVFYKSVGHFGAAFIAFEEQYFSMQT